ncbi:MAG: metallophosphoesterase [Candidatus Hodarchaeota archaeon]
MNVLFSADFEGNFTRLFQLAKRADICICCGDIFNYHQHPPSDFEFPLPFFSIKGNKDLWGKERLQRALESCYNFFWLDEQLTRLKELTGLHFFGIDHEREPYSIPNDIDVLISHQPAFGLADQCSAPFRSDMIIRHCGSKEIRRLVDHYQPRLLIAGHVHRFQKQQTENTLALTLAPALNEPIIMLQGKKLLKLTISDLIQ